MSNNQPAFPLPDIQAAEPGTVEEMRAMARGMTLRDYFAGKAMQTLLEQNKSVSYSLLCAAAYDIADAMMKERDE